MWFSAVTYQRIFPLGASSPAQIAPTPQLHIPAGALFGNQSYSELSAPVQDSILTDLSSFLGSSPRLGESGAA
jgi:hypothetical protein